MDVEKRQSFLAFFYICFAYIISVGIRLYLAKFAFENETFLFQGAPIELWTYDSGLYGFYAKELIRGVSLPFNSEYMPGYLLYAFYKIGISLKTAIFYSPIFLASLVVVPLSLIGAHFKWGFIGIFAGVFTSLSLAYYARSTHGYYDTDVLNLFFILMILYGIVLFSTTSKFRYILITLISSLCFSLWYHSFIAISATLFLGYAFYILLFERKNVRAYLFLFALITSILPVLLWYKIAIMLVFLALYFIHTKINYKIFLALFFILALALVITKSYEKIYQRANDYIFKTQTITSNSLHFKNTLKTVSEANPISFSQWWEDTLYHYALLPLCLVGFLLLCLKNRVFLLFVPLMILGVLSMKIGSRFTMYGVAGFALGLAYWIVVVDEIIRENLRKFTFIYQISLRFLFVIVLFYSAKFDNWYSSTIEPVFKNKDLNLLLSIKDKNPKIITWWDFGWPLWYYTNAKTLIDNGKHFEDNYIVSKLMLSSDQNFSKNTAKASFSELNEAYKNGYKNLASYIFAKDEPELALQKLANKGQKNGESVYFYFSDYLIPLLFNIDSFSNINLKTGKQEKSSYINKLDKRYNIFTKEKGKFQALGTMYDIYTYYNPKEDIIITYPNKSKYYLIDFKTHYIFCTKDFYDSFIIKILVKRQIDNDLFEIINSNESSIILKTK